MILHDYMTNRIHSLLIARMDDRGKVVSEEENLGTSDGTSM